MKQYVVNEIFYSLQGEGVRAGTANYFIRMTGCNMRCAVEPGDKSPGGFDCDTEFVSGRSMTAAEIAEACRALNGFCEWAIFTGGEPGLQVDVDLVKELHSAGIKCAIETNGSIDVSQLGLDWITVSPKVAEHAVRQMTADEVKYVRGYGQGIPKPACDAKHNLISPAFDGMELDARALAWCIKLCKESPMWRLSVQQHKAWRVR